MIILPYEIETLTLHRPWANWAIIVLSCAASVWLWTGEHTEEAVQPLVLSGWSLPGLLTHMFLHADIWHLIGNMVFLWVFGNAICANTSNLIYPAIYFGLGLIAAITHIAFENDPALGASGAVNGIVGMALALYPRNQVGMFWLLGVKPITFQCRLWLVAVMWLAFDVWGVVSEGQGVAYFAHIGGLIGGVALGCLGLDRGWWQLTEWDHRSLLEWIKGEHPPGRTWD